MIYIIITLVMVGLGVIAAAYIDVKDIDINKDYYDENGFMK